MTASRYSWRSRSVTLVLLTLIVPIALQAQEPGAGGKRTRPVKIETTLEIDGVLEEAAWASAAIVDDMHQVLPVEYAEPTEPTTVYLLYDEEFLYFGAQVWDSEPDLITAQILRQGELLSTDDAFALMLSPFNDQRTGYFFSVNPNGVRVEGLFQDVTRILMDWDWMK